MNRRYLGTSKMSDKKHRRERTEKVIQSMSEGYSHIAAVFYFVLAESENQSYTERKYHLENISIENMIEAE